MRKCMRQIQDAVNAHGNNLQALYAVITRGELTTIYYRNSEVAAIDWVTHTLTFDDCGWRTKTTKQVINTVLALFGRSIYQRQFKWFLNELGQNDAWDTEVTGKTTIHL